MELFQVLDCSTTLGTCCSSYGVAEVISVTRKIFGMIQIIAPILLIIATTIQFVKLVINPEEKNGFKKIQNKYIAAIIIFMIPILVDVVLGLLPKTFSVAACWDEAVNATEIGRTVNNSYLSESASINAFNLTDGDYESGNAKPEPTPGASGPNVGNAQTGSLSGGGSSSSGSSSSVDYGTGTGRGSAKGNQIVSYARQFIGKPYVFGGRWNGELPYTATDCSGFVSGVYKHFGINLVPQTESMWGNTSTYTLVSPGDIRAGDVVMYDGHVGLLTGNGTEIIHAKGKKYGVVSDPDYRKCSSHGIRGIMRIKGVN